MSPLGVIGLVIVLIVLHLLARRYREGTLPPVTQAKLAVKDGMLVATSQSNSNKTSGKRRPVAPNGNYALVGCFFLVICIGIGAFLAMAFQEHSIANKDQTDLNTIPPLSSDNVSSSDAGHQEEVQQNGYE